MLKASALLTPVLFAHTRDGQSDLGGHLVGSTQVYLEKMAVE